MLRPVKSFKEMTIGALDGEIGKVKDTYFDDHEWTLRYLVVDTGGWLRGRKVLISPLSIREVSADGKRIDVALSRDQVENSPETNIDKPVSRQYESSFYDYYGYPYYWAGPFLWGPAPFPREVGDVGGDTARREISRRENYDPHLRSSNAVSGYHIEATDGSIGHVEDLLYDDVTWSVRYLVVDTRNWLPGRKVLVSPEWVQRVSWGERRAYVNLTQEAVRTSPEYTGEEELTENVEQQLYRHYGRDAVREWSRGGQLR